MGNFKLKLHGGGSSLSKLIIKNNITDFDGNIYTSVVIGTQIWMVENLKTTHYNDGTPIPYITNNTDWSNDTSGAYCWYNNDELTYKNPYGALYNWYAVDNIHKLAPKGWRVPTDDDFTVLTTYLGGFLVAGGKLKETGLNHWTTPNAGATNQYGFTALPGGWRDNIGSFDGIKDVGVLFTSSSNGSNEGWYRGITNEDPYISTSNAPSVWGFSIRLIKDL